MRNKPIQADQLIPTSSTPPPEAGFYRIDRKTIGVVGNMSFRDPNTQAMMPVGKGAIPFPGFAPRLLASLVASSTAECTSGVVTVTATSHGIISTVFDGFEFYYPGSANLAAGWYGNFSRTGVNTFTFSAPLAANFSSESINSGSAFTDEITFASITLPPNTMSAGDIVRAVFACNQDATSNNRTQRFKIGSTTICNNGISTSSSSIIMSLAFSVVGQLSQFGAVSREHSAASSEVYTTEDISNAVTLSVTNQLAAAGCYSAITSLKLEIK